MKSKVTRVNSGEFIGIYINGILHLKYLASEFRALQSYYNGFADRDYRIEITGVGWNIMLTYLNKKLWQDILKLLSV